MEMPPTKNRRGRKKDTIHFINARPSSENERINIQRVVRAHVGRWISDQTKDRSTALPGAAIDGQLLPHPLPPPLPPSVKLPPELEADETLFPSSASSSSSPSLGSSPHSPESTTSNSILSLRPPSQQTQSVPKETPEEKPSIDSCERWPAEDCDHSPESPCPPAIGKYIEAIGANVLDPFRTYPARYSPEVVTACETYCAQSPVPVALSHHR